MTLPNLVIAGAPKCGTSSLFTWLVDHPDVCGSTRKETFFLMDEDSPLRRSECNFHDHGLDAYERFFRGCGPEHRIAVEATTHYIYQETALDVLASLPTQPRLLFVLRKPSERIFSSFSFSKNNLGRVRADLTFADFVRIAMKEPDTLERATGPSAYVLARDIQYSRYADYLSRWRQRIGEERMRILLFETMRSDPRREMTGLCSWLGLDPSFYDTYDFAGSNPTVEVRSPRLQRIAKALGGRASAGPFKEAIKRLYLALQSRRARAPRSADDAAVLAELDEEFRPHNERLAREFGLNLSLWD